MSNLLAKIEQWVGKEFGIKIHEHQHHRINKALSKQDYFKENSIDHILENLYKKNEEAVRIVTDIVTVQESYFFRDRSLFEFLKNIYLPNLIEKKRQDQNLNIKIWSAACSRGEEIYSIAILLNELISDYDDWHIELLGTDINTSSLKQGASGLYRQSSLRTTDDYLEKKYFTKDNGFYKISPELISKVSLKYHNLCDYPYPDKQYDMILCRNVFIYFDKSTIEMILKELEKCLLLEGVLFLGPSDIVTYMKHTLKYCFSNGVTFYTKKTEDKKPISFLPSDKDLLAGKEMEEFSYAETQTSIAEILNTIKSSLRKDPASALSLVNIYANQLKDSALLYQYKAEALLMLNDIATALDTCDIGSKLDPKNYHFNLIKGIILFEKDMIAAESCFRKVLVLSPKSVEANYYLAQIYLTKNDKKNAVNYFNKAKTIILSQSDKMHLLGFENESIESFILELNKYIDSLSGDS